MVGTFCATCTVTGYPCFIQIIILTYFCELYFAANCRFYDSKILEIFVASRFDCFQNCVLSRTEKDKSGDSRELNPGPLAP